MKLLDELEKESLENEDLISVIVEDNILFSDRLFKMKQVLGEYISSSLIVESYSKNKEHYIYKCFISDVKDNVDIEPDIIDKVTLRKINKQITKYYNNKNRNEIKQYKYDKDVAMHILRNMSEQKKKILEKALYRNELLTSVRNLQNCEFNDCKDGFYLVFKGTRTKFSVYMNNDMKYTRKPKNIEIIRQNYLVFDENDYKTI